MVSASDSRPEGWGFKSLWVHIFFATFNPTLTRTNPFFALATALPPELRWQSGRLLTDRSLVRSQVVAHIFFFPKRKKRECKRVQSARAERRSARWWVGRPQRTSLWPNWIRRLTTNQKIGGSSPSRDIHAALSLHGLMDKAHPS